MRQNNLSGGSERTYPLRMPPGWEPPVPAFSSEFGASTKEISMAVIGCQFSRSDRDRLYEVVAGIELLLRKIGRADHVDLSECTMDGTGHSQFVATCYWLKPDAMAKFFETPDFKSFWARHSTEGLGYGVFREFFNIPVKRFETLHSGPDHVVGIAHARQSVTDPILRHAYWGSMRDRIEESATDELAPTGDVEVLEEGPNRVVVRPNQNLAIIRSGQDLTKTTGIEREEYFSDIEPVLKAGMNFLRDAGLAEVNCIDCRYMSLLQEGGARQDHTYGLAYFRSLKDLEQWAEFHPTHLAIFNAFMEFAPRYGPEMRSRYWHEVSVLPAVSQIAEYVNCAPGTGLLSGVRN